MKLIKKIKNQSKLQDIIFALIGSTLIATNQLHSYISNLILTSNPSAVNGKAFIDFLSGLSSYDIQVVAISLVLTAFIVAIAGWITVSIIFQILQIIKEKIIKKD